MRDAWLKLVDGVLCPARARREVCETECARHAAARRAVVGGRLAKLEACVARIEAARAEVFAAADGVVPSRMTELEREWRRASRPDEEGAVMDLWARIAPASWIDRKRWRDADPGERLDAAVALASDVEGVEAAEAAVAALRTALSPWGSVLPARVRWRPRVGDYEATAVLLAAPCRAVDEALAGRDGANLAACAAERLERDVEAAALARLPERPVLARALAHAARFDVLWRAVPLTPLANPVTSLRALWATGYVLSAIDARDVTLELVALQAPTTS